MSERRFLASLFGTVAAGAGLVALLCFLVDPYLVFGRPRTTGFNQLKPAVSSHEPMMKAYQASRACARTVILGSSRSGIGLDPAATAWPASMRPVYNLSLAGTDLADAVQLLGVILAHCGDGERPLHLVVGLDFESFLRLPRAARARSLPDPATLEQQQRLRLLARPAGGRPAMPDLLWRDGALSLLTAGALVDSLATLRASHDLAGADLLETGNSSEWQLRQWTLADGAGQMFHQKHLATARRLSRPHGISDEPDGTLHGQAALDSLLALALARGMHVRLAVQPSHVTHHELLAALGYWPDFERWKRVLAAQGETWRQRGLDLRIWDFGGYDAAYLEPVPDRGRRGPPMAAFWDPVHYNTRLGARLISAWTGSPAHASELGTELLASTVDQRLQQVVSARAHWRQHNGTVLAQAQGYRCAVAACAEPMRTH